MHAPEPWSIYEGRVGIASVGRITLTAAFANLVACSAGFDPYDLPSIFAAPEDEADNDACRDLVRLDAELLAQVFISGRITTFARPIDGGEVTPILPDLWEIDDPLPRFSTGLFSRTEWARPTATPTHRIFVAADQFDDWLVALRPDRDLSARELAAVGDPIVRAAWRIRRRAGSLEPEPSRSVAEDQPSTVALGAMNAGAAPILLTIKQVSAMVGLGRSTIYARMQQGEFPPSLPLGAAVRWHQSEVMRWIGDQAARRGGD